MIPFLWHYKEKPGKASIKSSESVIQATFITIRWTAPADDGGSPITGYQLILQKGETELEKDAITNPGTTSYSFRGLEKNTNYTVKLFSRNFVFEGDPTVWNIKTKFEVRNHKWYRDWALSANRFVANLDLLWVVPVLPSYLLAVL